MNVKMMQVGPIGTNCYILTDETTLKCAVIDPGGDSNMILNYLEENKLDCVAIFLTHGHMDHTMGVEGVQKETGAPVYLHQKDYDPKPAGGMFGMSHTFTPTGECRLYGEGDVIPVGSLQVKVLDTPGHTPGGVTLVCENAMFTGDTLFHGDIGRTDFPRGDDRQMNASLAKLAALEGDFRVLPGHEEDSTLEEERRLRQLLAEMPPGDQLADEAKAVMGFSLCAPRRKKARLMPQGVRAWLSAAAAIAIVFTIGLFMPDSHDSPPDMIYACINGHEVTDNNEVMLMMQAELSDMAEASEYVSDCIDEEWNAMREAFDETQQ